MFFSNDLYFLLPELFWVLVGVSLLLFSTLLTTRLRLVLMPRLGYIFICFVLYFAVLYVSLPTIEYAVLDYQYVSDQFAFSFKLVFLFLLILCVYSSIDYYFLERVFFVEYYFLIIFFCVSSFLLISSNDFTLFYLAIELQSLVLYTLAALKRYNVFSTESGLKYFVLGAFSSGLLLFSISLFYGFYGFLNFYEAKFVFLGWFVLSTHYAIALAIIFLLSALMFKLAAAPFHIWIPDVYEGAPSAVVLLFSILPKLAVLAFIVKLFAGFLYEYSAVWYSVLFFAGIFSVIVGTFGALNQINIKRLYAYSAIVNIGYLITAASYGTLESFTVLFNYLCLYFFSTIAIFLVLMLFRNLPGLKKIKYLLEYSAFATYSSLLAIFIALIFFSLAGVPPLAGFFIKFFLFKVIFVADFLANPGFFIILIMSVISSFYYIRVVRFLFFTNTRKPVLFAKLNYFVVFVFVVVCAWMFVFFFFQPAILSFIEYLSASLYF